MTYTNQIMKTERMPFCCEARGHIFFNGIQAARPEKCKQDQAARPEGRVGLTCET